MLNNAFTSTVNLCSVTLVLSCVLLLIISSFFSCDHHPFNGINFLNFNFFTFVEMRNYWRLLHVSVLILESFGPHGYCTVQFSHNPLFTYWIYQYPLPYVRLVIAQTQFMPCVQLCCRMAKLRMLFTGLFSYVIAVFCCDKNDGQCIAVKLKRMQNDCEI